MLLTTKQFLAQIDRFLKDTGMSDNTFGRLSCNNSKFLWRLRDGIRRGTGDVKLGQVHAIQAWMREERERRKQEAREARKTAAE